MKVRAVIRMIEADGWAHVATHGSHCRYEHLDKPRHVTIAGAQTDEVAPGTLGSILKPAGLR